MTNLLLENQKTNIRFEDKDIILYEPSEEQYIELIRILENEMSIKQDLSIQGEVDFKHIRYIIRNMTSIGHSIDEMTDEEVENALNNGNRRIKILFREITDMIYEILEDIQWKHEQEIKLLNTFINIINSKDGVDKINSKLQKFMKKNGIDLSLEEISSLSRNPENIDEIMNKIKSKPQDRKRKSKNK